MEKAEGRNDKSFPMEKADAGRVLGFSDNLEDSDKSRRCARGTCLAVLDLVNHALIVGLTAYTIYRSWGSNVVNLHTIFCTTGVRISRSMIIKHFSNAFPRFKITPLGFRAIISFTTNASNASNASNLLLHHKRPRQGSRLRKTGKGERANRRNFRTKSENSPT